MKWPWRRRRARLIEPMRASVSSKAMELETAKEILAEVFGARPGEVEEMLIKRLEERKTLSAMPERSAACNPPSKW